MLNEVGWRIGFVLIAICAVVSFAYVLSQATADRDEDQKDQLSVLDWNEIHIVSYSSDLTRMSRALAVVCDYTIGITPMSRYNSALSIIKQMEYIIEKRQREEREMIWQKHHKEADNVD